jgi:uncharacterized membrane protein
MPRPVLALLLVLPVFLALDAVWLTLAADKLYRPAIGHLMREGFDGSAAALFYLLYGCAMVGFVVLPSRDTRAALLRGACFGLVAYATYDLTNQATLRGWPWHVTLLDLAWGSFATAASCGVAQRILRLRSRPSGR